MLLIESDGKALFREFGIPTPASHLSLSRQDVSVVGPGPWIVKAQVTTGGRGKAGGIQVCQTRDGVQAALARMFASEIRHHRVHACLIEEAVHGEEAYLSVVVDAAAGGLRIIYSDRGGIDIEITAEEPDALLTEDCGASLEEAYAAVTRIASRVSAARRTALNDVGHCLVDLFFERDLLLAEINPLFWIDGQFLAGDAKVIVDVNALDRQNSLRDLIASRPVIYSDVKRKLQEGFDYIDLDPNGRIGLVTTGAGLSMMLIDEIILQGGLPANFCDVRTGQLRGSPDRIVRILEWLTSKPSLRVILVNIFAGITDLVEFADLLDQALSRCEVRVPVLVRIVGNRESEARKILKERRPSVAVFADLDEAVSHSIKIAAQ